MLERLVQLAADAAGLQRKLVFLVGEPGTGKSGLLAKFGDRVGVTPLRVGSALGRQLAELPQKQRRLEAGPVFKSLLDQQGELLLLDNIELLFDASLQLNPLDLLKRIAQVKTVVAVWPGQLQSGRLVYAPMGHPEYRDYDASGLVTLEIK